MTTESQNPPPPTAPAQWPARKIVAALFTLAISASILDGFHTMYFSSEARALRDSRAAIAQFLGYVDAQLQPHALPGRRAFISFTGFEESQDSYIKMLYYRVVYSLYPTRTYIGNLQTAMFTGGQILQANRAVDEAWLRLNQIDSIVNIQRSNGIVHIGPPLTIQTAADNVPAGRSPSDSNPASTPPPSTPGNP